MRDGEGWREGERKGEGQVLLHIMLYLHNSHPVWLAFENMSRLRRPSHNNLLFLKLMLTWASAHIL